jgi:hypothetical protein
MQAYATSTIFSLLSLIHGRNCLGIVVCVQISTSAEATAAGVSEEPDASTTHGQSATTS